MILAAGDLRVSTGSAGVRQIATRPKVPPVGCAGWRAQTARERQGRFRPAGYGWGVLEADIGSRSTALPTSSAGHSLTSCREDHTFSSTPER